jgi:putative endonuclease
VRHVPPTPKLAHSTCSPFVEPTVDPRRAVGRVGEEFACKHFERLGFAILARNHRTRYGEIDAIAFDGHTLVFVEVKSTRVRTRGHTTSAPAPPEPLESLRGAQQARLKRLAAAWLGDPQQIRPRAEEIRFDAVGVVLDARDRLVRLEHLEAAW